MRTKHWAAAVVGLALALSSVAWISVPSEATGVEAGAVVTIAIAVLNEVKTAVESYGTAIAYAKVKLDGPDSDDRAIDYEYDADHGLDWNLDAETDFVRAYNDYDDGTEVPYTKGVRHCGWMEIHWDSTGGVWRPEPGNELHGYVSVRPDDDPVRKNDATAGAAVAAFSADGKTVDFCYSAGAQTNAAGRIEFEFARKVDCSPRPEFLLRDAAAFLVSTHRFAFNDLGGNRVQIQPLIDSPIDLFHSYLQESSNQRILPLLRGYDELVQELKLEGYEERIAGSSWILSEDPNVRADLTIVGASLELSVLELPRDGRTDAELLDAYFASEAVHVVAPEHAQANYMPRVLSRRVIHSGDDISDTIGRVYELPAGPDPATDPRERLTGLLVVVGGGIDDAVETALNTEDHFVRQLATSGWDGISSAVEFRIQGMDYHYESPSTFADIALASPQTDNGTMQASSISFALGYSMSAGGDVSEKFRNGIVASSCYQHPVSPTFSLGIDVQARFSSERVTVIEGDMAIGEYVNSLAAIPMSLCGIYRIPLLHGIECSLSAGFGAAWATLSTEAPYVDLETYTQSEVHLRETGLSWCAQGKVSLDVSLTRTLQISLQVGYIHAPFTL